MARDQGLEPRSAGSEPAVLAIEPVPSWGAATAPPFAIGGPVRSRNGGRPSCKDGPLIRSSGPRMVPAARSRTRSLRFTKPLHSLCASPAELGWATGIEPVLTRSRRAVFTSSPRPPSIEVPPRDRTASLPGCSRAPLPFGLRDMSGTAGRNRTLVRGFGDRVDATSRR